MQTLGQTVPRDREVILSRHRPRMRVIQYTGYPLRGYDDRCVATPSAAITGQRTQPNLFKSLMTKAVSLAVIIR
jgi:hypothetical protein